jgi:hypothetical protein
MPQVATVDRLSTEVGTVRGTTSAQTNSAALRFDPSSLGTNAVNHGRDRRPCGNDARHRHGYWELAIGRLPCGRAVECAARKQ